jgi:hypothetical protein
MALWLIGAAPRMRFTKENASPGMIVPRDRQSYDRIRGNTGSRSRLMREKAR